MSGVMTTDQSKGTNTLCPTEMSMKNSVKFIKRLLFIGISSVTHLRGVFEHDSFSLKNIDGHDFYILRNDSDASNNVKLMNQWVGGIFNAIESQYLEKVVLTFFSDPKHPEEVFETYTFNVSYKTGSVAITKGSNNTVVDFSDEQFKNLKQKAKKMILNLVYFTSNLDTLPDKEIYIGFRVHYLETAPPDFEIAGFISTSENLVLTTDSTDVKLGSLRTPFHGFSSYASFAAGNLNGENHMADEKIAGENDSTKNMTDGVSVELYGLDEGNSPQVDADNGKANEVVNGEKPHHQQLLERTDDVTKENEESLIVCPCGLADEIEGMMLECGKCGKFQHAFCFGIRDSMEVDALMQDMNGNPRHFCTECCEADDLPFTDVHLSNQRRSGSKLRAYCLFRRSLNFAASMTHVSVNLMVTKLGINTEDAEIMLARLIKFNLVDAGTARTKKKRVLDSLRDSGLLQLATRQEDPRWENFYGNDGTEDQVATRDDTEDQGADDDNKDETTMEDESVLEATDLSQRVPGSSVEEITEKTRRATLDENQNVVGKDHHRRTATTPALKRSIRNESNEVPVKRASNPRSPMMLVASRQSRRNKRSINYSEE